MQIVTSWMEEGIERGRKEGRDREIQLVLRMLPAKFGSLDTQISDRIISLEIEQLEDLGVTLLNFQTVEELKQWLQKLSDR